MKNDTRFAYATLMLILYLIFMTLIAKIIFKTKQEIPTLEVRKEILK